MFWRGAMGGLSNGGTMGVNFMEMVLHQSLWPKLELFAISHSEGIFMFKGEGLICMGGGRIWKGK